MTSFKKSFFSKCGAAFLLLPIVAACGGSHSGDGGITPTPTATSTPDAPSVPTIVSVSPPNGSTGASTVGSVTAIFSEAMDPSTLTETTFTLTSGSMLVPVAGTLTKMSTAVVFTPAVTLSSNGAYTATITTGAQSAAHVALAADHAWSFHTSYTRPPIGTRVDLASAGNYVMLAKSAISTVPTSAITGNLGISPAAASFITGFSLVADASTAFSRADQVTGLVYASDYGGSTPTLMTTAISDMELAYTDAAGRAPTVPTELGAGDIGGMTLVPGVYTWGTGLNIPTSVFLNGGPNDVWIFQVAQDLTMANAKHIYLEGGAVPQNVFWQVAGQVTIGTTAHFEGVILSKTAITLGTGASINGRMLAQTAIAIDSSTVVAPAQ